MDDASYPAGDTASRSTAAADVTMEIPRMSTRLKSA